MLHGLKYVNQVTVYYKQSASSRLSATHPLLLVQFRYVYWSCSGSVYWRIHGWQQQVLVSVLMWWVMGCGPSLTRLHVDRTKFRPQTCMATCWGKHCLIVCVCVCSFFSNNWSNHFKMAVILDFFFSSSFAAEYGWESFLLLFGVEPMEIWNLRWSQHHRVRPVFSHQPTPNFHPASETPRYPFPQPLFLILVLIVV